MNGGDSRSELQDVPRDGAELTLPQPAGPWRIDLDVFEGPFDLLITLVLNEEIDLLEVQLAEVVLAYLEHLERKGELDLEAATEFLMLIAALLELKSRLMLPGEEMEGLDLDPGEAVEELLARLLGYRQFRDAADYMHQRLAEENSHRYRSAPLPPSLRQIAVDAAEQVYQPAALGKAIAGMLQTPPAINLSHVHRPVVSLDRRLSHLRELLGSRHSFTFNEAVAGEDRMTQAVTLFALLELYKSGELVFNQRENFGEIEIEAGEASTTNGTI